MILLGRVSLRAGIGGQVTGPPDLLNVKLDHLSVLDEFELVKRQVIGFIGFCRGRGQRRGKLDLIKCRLPRVQRRVNEHEFFAVAGVIVVPEAFALADKLGNDLCLKNQLVDVPDEVLFGEIS